MKLNVCWRSFRFPTSLSPKWTTLWGRTRKLCSCNMTSKRPPHPPTPTESLIKQWCWRHSLQTSVNSDLLFRLTSVLQDRDEEVRSLQSDLQHKNSDITGLSHHHCQTVILVLSGFYSTCCCWGSSLKFESTSPGWSSVDPRGSSEEHWAWRRPQLKHL